MKLINQNASETIKINDLVATLMYNNNIPFDWYIIDKMTDEVIRALQAV